MKEKINCKYGYCAKVSTGQNEANKPKRCGVVGEGEPNPNRGKSPELQFPRQVQVPGIKPGESRQEYKGGGGYLNKNSKSRKGEAKRKEKKRKEDISIRRIRICRQSEMN